MTNTTPPIAPERSTEQRLQALKEANRIRSRRAELKRELASGRKAPADLLGDEDCATMKVIDMLLGLPKVGRVKASRALTTARISPSKTLEGLTARQRHELLDLLPVGMTPNNLGGAELTRAGSVAPIHSVPQPNQRGRRRRGLDDLLSDIERA